MPAIITNDLRIRAADFFKNDVDNIPTYIFIGGTTAWADETQPPNVEDTTLEKIFAVDEIIGMKRVQQADVLSVIVRHDWIQGTVYDEYRDDVNLIDNRNPVTDDFYKFYVVTDEFSVYKCLSNNNRAPSQNKPSGTTTSSFQTPDGYIWKYLYTIRSEDAFRYMTPNWMPCYTLYGDDGSAQWLVQTSATPGTIDNTVLTDGGANFNSASQPTITITGDGTGAEAIAEIDDELGTITRIVMTSVGQGYTEATINITDPTGSGVGATATPVISPIEGHGFDPRRELGATYKMIRIIFDRTEGGSLPINIDYRKAGILMKPLSNVSGVTLSIGETKFFTVGETVTGATSGATGVIRVIDSVSGYLHLDNTVGTFSQGETVSSATYNQTTIIQVFNTDNLPLTASVVPVADYKPLSGELLYFSTREKITRGPNQTEEIRFIIAF